jgi:hypothetical protein
MRAEIVVGAGAALLIGALAGVEWWAEHQWVAHDAVVRSGDRGGWIGDRGETSLPETSEVDASEALASPRLSR